MVYRSPYPPVQIPGVSYPDLVFGNAPHRGAHAVFIDGPSSRELTLAGVERAARRFAKGLLARGLRRQEAVAIFSPNLPEYAIAFHGIALAGGIVTTANPLYTAEELAHQLRDTRARFII